MCRTDRRELNLIEGDEFYDERECCLEIYWEEDPFPELFDEFLQWLNTHPKYKDKFELFEKRSTQ